MYRMHQVLHTLIDKFTRSAIGIILPTLLVIIISAFYSIIRFHRVLNPFMLLVVLLVGLLLSFNLCFGLYQGTMLTQSSQMYCKLYCSILPSGVMNKLDITIFKSLAPLTLRVGEAVNFIISINAILIIVNDVIIANIINLVVAF